MKKVPRLLGRPSSTPKVCLRALVLILILVLLHQRAGPFSRTHRSFDILHSLSKYYPWQHEISAQELSNGAHFVIEPPFIGSDTCDEVKTLANSLPEIDWLAMEDMSDTTLEGWEDDWIAHGKVPAQKNTIKAYDLDFVYTYVDANEKFLRFQAPFKSGSSKRDEKWISEQARRYRSWDELRYSVRGTIQYAASWLSRIHIIVPDYADEDKEQHRIRHVAQKPPWLNLSHVDVDPLIQIVPQSSIMTSMACAPTFSSLSIESSLGNIPLSTNHFIALSDDMMIGRETASTDFVSPLFGMSFNWYDGYLNNDETVEPDLNDGELGEAHSSRHTSYLLNKRFGRRLRGLQVHQAKVINQNILRDALRTFPQSALGTSLVRFRDEGYQLNLWYLHMHFTMEMHREALLRSIVMRFDANEDGALQVEERNQLMKELETGAAKSKKYRADRSLWREMSPKFTSTGLSNFKIQSPRWSSMYGPQQIRGLELETCRAHFTAEKCFGRQFMTSNNYSLSELDSRLVGPDSDVLCGDCLIKFFLPDGHMGYESLLPSKESVYRERVIKALHKYQYTKTKLDQKILQVRGVESVKWLSTLAKKKKGLICINDDITTDDPEELKTIAQGYHDFFEAAYPKPSLFEKGATRP